MMEQINDGYTSCDKIIFYLEELFQLGNIGVIENQFAHLENHKGYWIIGFKSVPNRALLMSLLALFETRMAFDGIGTIVFYYGQPREARFEDLAGSFYNSESVVELLQAHDLLYPIAQLEKKASKESKEPATNSGDDLPF